MYFASGIWIAIAGYNEGFYYSRDAQNWKQTRFPDAQGWEFTQTEEVIRFNGLWLWRFKERKEYSYVEKGPISDSTKNGSYDNLAIFCTADLSCESLNSLAGPSHKRWAGF